MQGPWNPSRLPATSPGKVSLQRQEELETVCAKLQRQVGEMEVREVACPQLSASRARVRARFSGVSSAHTPHRVPPRFLSFVSTTLLRPRRGPASGSVALSSPFPPQDLGPVPSLPPEMGFPTSPW